MLRREALKVLAATVAAVPYLGRMFGDQPQTAPVVAQTYRPEEPEVLAITPEQTIMGDCHITIEGDADTVGFLVEGRNGERIGVIHGRSGSVSIPRPSPARPSLYTVTPMDRHGKPGRPAHGVFDHDPTP